MPSSDICYCLPACVCLWIHWYMNEFNKTEWSTIHISNTIAKAHHRANTIWRTFVSRDINVLIRAFIVYVRHIHEYNPVVWSHLSMLEILNVLSRSKENLQRSTTWAQVIHVAYTYADRLRAFTCKVLNYGACTLTLSIWCYNIGLVLST